MHILVVFPQKELPSMGLVQMTLQHPPSVMSVMCQDIISPDWCTFFRYIFTETVYTLETISNHWNWICKFCAIQFWHWNEVQIYPLIEEKDFFSEVNSNLILKWDANMDYKMGKKTNNLKNRLNIIKWRQNIQIQFW